VCYAPLPQEQEDISACNTIITRGAELALKAPGGGAGALFLCFSETIDRINWIVLWEAAAVKILIVEDETLLADSMQALLESKGFQVETVHDGKTGEAYAELGIYDLLILDVMMPKMDGYQLARALRAGRCATPILMLTAKSALEDRITGLNAGADYYLTKPFDSGELLACVNALLRRQGNQVDELAFGNTALDLASCTLVCGEKSVRLSAREFDVMRLLLLSGRRNLSKESILTRVWGYESDAVENHVEVYVGFLRKKLRSIGSNIRIEAIRRLGYHLEVDGSC
jgi:DNA-binding response OmpR family regulator